MYVCVTMKYLPLMFLSWKMEEKEEKKELVNFLFYVFDIVLPLGFCVRVCACHLGLFQTGFGACIVQLCQHAC